MLSFLKDEDKKESVGLSDLILLLVIIAIGAGAYFYFTRAESKTIEEFSKAELLFKEKKFQEASEAYTELMEASWTNSELEAILYWNSKVLDVVLFPPQEINPLDSLAAHWSLFTQLDSLYTQDTLAFIRSFSMPEQTAFMRYDQYHKLEIWDSVHTLYEVQKRNFETGNRLWASQDLSWSGADTAAFISSIDSIGSAHYLDSAAVTRVLEWKAFKEVLKPKTEE